MTATPLKSTTRRENSRTLNVDMPEDPRKPLNQMTPDEIRVWIRTTRRALVQKKAREQAYLDRRSRRGIHKPIDDAYEQDQRFAADLLALLDEIEAMV